MNSIINSSQQFQRKKSRLNGKKTYCISKLYRQLSSCTNCAGYIWNMWDIFFCTSMDKRTCTSLLIQLLNNMAYPLSCDNLSLMRYYRDAS